MCRKLETEQEKVLPFYVSSLTEEEEEQTRQAEQEEPKENLAKVNERRSLSFFPDYFAIDTSSKISTTICMSSFLKTRTVLPFTNFAVKVFPSSQLF